MKKYLVILAFTLLCPMAVYAVTDEEISAKYISGKDPQLTSQEETALGIGKKWQTGPATSKPTVASDGSIRFIFGTGQTKIVCALLQVCDVALQTGEMVTGLNIGDTRFLVTPALSGVGTGSIVHLVIKPVDVGLDTSLIVTTDRRTYHFSLRSTKKESMPYASFSYPEEEMAKWESIRHKMESERQNNTIPETGEYLGDMNFKYKIEGNTRWKPVRVYNNGIKTIIQMPPSMKQTDAPALLVVKKDGGLFSDSTNAMVNYRLQGDRYIVDTVFDKAILIAGAGDSQESITITRE